ncbi:MAG: hypothetical protein ACSW8E_01895, partial [Clostridia bacterium]
LGLKSYGACVDLLVNYYDPLIPAAPSSVPDDAIELPIEDEFAAPEEEAEDGSGENEAASSEAESPPEEEGETGSPPPEENNP